MNIGVDIRCFMTPYKTGVGEYAYELLQALFILDKKNKYYLFYNSAKDFSGVVPKWDQANVFFIKKAWPNKLFNLSQKLLAWPKINKLIGVELDWFFSPNISLVSLSSSVKQILTIHDLSFLHFPDCYSLKMRIWHKFLSPKKQCQKADIVLTPSKNTKQDIVNTYGVEAKKIEVVYPGLSSIFTKNDGEEVKNLPEKYILFLGTVEPRKNIVCLIKAFNSSDKLKRMGYKLILVGKIGWGEREVVRLILQSSDIIYLSYISAEQKVHLYKKAGLFVYPSLYEGFGFPVLEAMACGTPTITSNRSSLPEVASGACVLVNPNSVGQIKDSMETILTNNNLKNYLIDLGSKRAMDFNWTVAAERFLNILTSYENRN